MINFQGSKFCGLALLKEFVGKYSQLEKDQMIFFADISIKNTKFRSLKNYHL